MLQKKQKCYLMLVYIHISVFIYTAYLKHRTIFISYFLKDIMNYRNRLKNLQSLRYQKSPTLRPLPPILMMYLKKKYHKFSSQKRIIIPIISFLGITTAKLGQLLLKIGEVPPYQYLDSFDQHARLRSHFNMKIIFSNNIVLHPNNELP